MVDRQRTLVDFVTAWAEYQMRLSGIGSEAKKLAIDNPGLHQMIGRITDELASSPEDQRQLALRLAIAEFTKGS